jgi:hypothetical protein
MIYKFNDYEQNTFLEVELFNEENQSKGLTDNVNLCITNESNSEFFSVNLSKKDIYHLIGALHLLHKEMK